MRGLFVVLALGALGCASEEPNGNGGASGAAAAVGGPAGIGAAGMGITGGTGVSGMTGGTGIVAGMTGGTVATGGVGGMMTGGAGGMMTGGAGGMMTGGMGGTDPDAMVTDPDAGGMMGAGDCCPDGNCLCHGEPPTALTNERGPFDFESYDQGVGCVYYPTDAEPPFAAVAIADGLGGSGGCGRTQTDQWGPLYASWGIVAMIVKTGSGDQPSQRGTKLTGGIAAFKTENTKMGSPLFGKLAGRYGTSGFSMGGGGTTFAAQDDSTLLTSVGVMAYGPTGTGVTVPTLFICGSSDGLAGCASHGTRAYNAMADTVLKARVTISSGHVGQPSAASGSSGKHGLAFQKVYLEGDTRWKDMLLAADWDASTLK